MGWAPQVGRSADYLPSGTVGQWPPATCNGGPCTRAATRKPTRWGRLGPLAGIPKRMRPNCHKRRYSQTSVDCINTKRRGGPKTPLYEGKGPENPGVVAPFTVAGCRGNRRRAVNRRLGKIDLRPCPLRLRSSLLVLGCTGLMRSTGFRRLPISFEGSPDSVHRQSAELPCCASETWDLQCYCSEDRRDPTDAVLGQVGR